MEYETMKLVAAAGLMAIGTLATATAVGRIGNAALNGLARNPEAKGPMMTHMILAIAFAEAIAIYALIISIIILMIL